MRPLRRLLPGVLLLGLVGCALEFPTTIDQKFTLKPREMKTFTATATAKTQNLVVIVKSPGNTVDVGIVPDEDVGEAKEAMKAGKEPPKNFNYFAGTEDAELKFTTHPNKGFAVIIRS